MTTNKYVLPKRFIGKKPEEKTMMRVTFGLLMYLDRKAGRHESYEDVIWRMVFDRMTDKEKKEFKKSISFEDKI